MNRYKNYFNLFIILLLTAVIVVSSIFLIYDCLEEKKQVNDFKELEKIVEVTDVDEATNEEETQIEQENNEIENTEDETKNIQIAEDINLHKLYNINSDLVGWIRIDGTNINYPVMQNGNFYLRRNFYKDYSSCGTPYLAEYCGLKTSDNLILYGHHMDNKTMFSALDNYKRYNFYKKHQYINFYTLENGKTIKNTYEVIYTFKTIAYSDSGFKYNSFYIANTPDQFDDFIRRCDELSFYTTGKTAKYGDKLITLSTCEYSQKNGRMVVVGRKI